MRCWDNAQLRWQTHPLLSGSAHSCYGMQGLRGDSGDSLGVESSIHLPWKCFPKEGATLQLSLQCPCKVNCSGPGCAGASLPAPSSPARLSAVVWEALIQEVRGSWTLRQCAELIGSLEMHKPRLTVYLFSSSTRFAGFLHVFVHSNPSHSLPDSISPDLPFSLLTPALCSSYLTHPSQSHHHPYHLFRRK